MLCFLGHSVSVTQLSTKGFKPTEPVRPEASVPCGLLRSGCSRCYGGHRPPGKRVSDGTLRPSDPLHARRQRAGSHPGPPGLGGLPGVHTGGIPWTPAPPPVPPATGSRTGSRSLRDCVSSSAVEAGPLLKEGMRGPDHLPLAPLPPAGKPSEAGPHRAQCSGPRGSPPARKGECLHRGGRRQAGGRGPEKPRCSARLAPGALDREGGGRGRAGREGKGSAGLRRALAVSPRAFCSRGL